MKNKTNITEKKLLELGYDRHLSCDGYPISYVRKSTNTDNGMPVGFSALYIDHYLNNDRWFVQLSMDNKKEVFNMYDIMKEIIGYYTSYGKNLRSEEIKKLIMGEK